MRARRRRGRVALRWIPDEGDAARFGEGQAEPADDLRDAKVEPQSAGEPDAGRRKPDDFQFFPETHGGDNGNRRLSGGESAQRIAPHCDGKVARDILQRLAKRQISAGN